MMSRLRIGVPLVLSFLAGVIPSAHAGWHALDTGGAAVAFDPAGNVIAAGGRRLDPDEHGDLVVEKRAAADGSLLWRFSLPGQEADANANAVVVDAAGDAFVAGELSRASFANAKPSTFLVVKLDGATGAEVWRYAIPATGHRGATSPAQDIVLLPDGGVVASGSTHTPDGQQFTVVRLDAGGTEVWRTNLMGSTFGGTNIASVVAVDPAGNIVAGGYTENVVTFLDFTVAKLSGATGTQLWRYVTGGTTWTYDNVGDIGFLPSGDVMASGFTENETTKLDGIVVRLDRDEGYAIWRLDFDSPGHFHDAARVAVGADGSVGVGIMYGTAPADWVGGTGVLAIQKVSSVSGALLWEQPLVGTGTGPSYVGQLLIDSVGDLIVPGALSNAVSGKDYTVAKLSGVDGSALWRHEVSSSEVDGNDIALDVALSAAGNVAATGSLGGRTIASLFDADGSPIPPPFKDEVLVPTQKLLVVDGGGVNKKKLTLLLKDASVVPPLIGSQADPRSAGAELLVRNPTSGEEMRVPLPAEGWVSAGSGFRYRGGTGSCRAVTLKNFTLKATCKGSAVGLTLDEATQGTLDLRVKFGALPGVPRSYCARTVAASQDEPGRYLAKASPAPDACPDVP